MVRRFLQSGRTGWYFAVAREGDVAAADEISLLERGQDELPVSEITRLHAHDRRDVDGLKRAIATASLTPDWREYFERRLEALLDASR